MFHERVDSQGSFEILIIYYYLWFQYQNPYD